MSSKKTEVTPQDEIMELSRSHPFYRDRLRDVFDFENVPLMRKQDLYEVVTATLSDPASLGSVYLSPTGGSTSNNLLFFPSDIRENHLQRELLSAHLTETGIFTKQTIALNLFGSNMMYRSSEIFNEFCEHGGGTPLPVGSSCDDKTAYKLGVRFHANTLLGTPSRVMQFARYAEEKRELQFEHLVFGGESLTERKVAFLKGVFGIRRISSIFGSAEAGIWSYQPPDLERNQYLFSPDMMHVEIHDADPSGLGEIVLTNLVRKRFPLLRYATGDMGRVTPTTHHGQKLLLLEYIGREQKSFQIGGEYYSTSDFDEVCNQLIDFQIQLLYDERLKKDRIRFLLVPYGPEYVEVSGDSIKETITSILQSNERLFTTDIEFVEMKDLLLAKTSRKVIRVVDDRP